MYPEIDPNRSRWSTWIKSVAGMFLAICSSIMFSSSGVAVRALSGVLHPAELGVYRFVAMAMLALPALFQSSPSETGFINKLFGSSWRTFFWIALRALFGGTALILRFYAYQVLPLGDATCIALSSTIFVTVFAWLFLKERITWTYLVCLILTCCGIALTARIDLLISSASGSNYRSRQDYLYGIVCSLTATIIISAAFVVLRHLKSVPSTLILFNYGWIACLETLIVTLSPLVGGFTLPALAGRLTNRMTSALFGNCTTSVSRDQDADQLLDSLRSTAAVPWLVLANTLLASYGQWVCTCAVQLEHAGLVSVVEAGSEVIFAFLLEWAFFGNAPDSWSLGGGALILCSVLILTFQRSRQRSS